MGVEFELKFSSQPEQQEAIYGAFSGDYATFDMETTYYDALDSALSERHITLRRRFENGESVCTVKTPTSGYGRGEWDCRCDKIEDAILELCKLGAPEELISLTAVGVAPICGAKFTRRALLLEFGEAELELALDKGILSGGGKEVPLCEVEVELKSGPEDAALKFGMVLAAKFGLIPQKKSKFRRALALAKGE
jgi:inorganic triphosphatase YgiF